MPSPAYDQLSAVHLRTKSTRSPNVHSPELNAAHHDSFVPGAGSQFDAPERCQCIACDPYLIVERAGALAPPGTELDCGLQQSVT